MGESRSNPNSQQFAGQLPDVQPSGFITWVAKPNAAFMEHVKEIRAAGIDGPIRCEERDQDAVLVALATWTVPMKTTREWPQSHLEMAELARMPLPAFKKAHKDSFERSGMSAAAATIVIPEEKKIEV